MSEKVTTKRPKTGGRKPGGLNKATVEMKFDLLETLRAKGFDPVAELVKTHELAREQFEARINKSASGFGSVGFLSIAKECELGMMEYIYAKLKSTELSGPGGSDLFQSFAHMMRDALDDEKNK